MELKEEQVMEYTRKEMSEVLNKRHRIHTSHQLKYQNAVQGVQMLTTSSI